MENKTVIYGYSDDSIYASGEISGSIDCYEICQKGVSFECSDGTKGIIQYHGEWNILVNQKGELFDNLLPALDEDSAEHKEFDAIGCPPYSDVLVFIKGMEWIQIGKKIFNR